MLLNLINKTKKHTLLTKNQVLYLKINYSSIYVKKYFLHTSVKKNTSVDYGYVYDRSDVDEGKIRHPKWMSWHTRFLYLFWAFIIYTLWSWLPDSTEGILSPNSIVEGWQHFNSMWENKIMGFWEFDSEKPVIVNESSTKPIEKAVAAKVDEYPKIPTKNNTNTNNIYVYLVGGLLVLCVTGLVVDYFFN